MPPSAEVPEIIAEVKKYMRRQRYLPQASEQGRPHAHTIQFVGRLFITPKKDGKQRPVIDLLNLNRHLEEAHFNMEGLQTVRSAETRRLPDQDGYEGRVRHCSKAVEHRHLLRFRSGGKLFEFQCLPFGLAPTPRVFTKALKPVVANSMPDGNPSGDLH